MKQLKLLIAVIVLAVVAVVGYSVFANRMQREHHEVTRMQNKAWVEEMFLREVRSITLSGDSVLIEFVEKTPPLRVREDRAEEKGEPKLQRYAPPDGVVEKRANAVVEKRGNAYALTVGSVISTNDYHGGSDYIIREILPDKVVVDYSAYHSIMMNTFKDSGTVELAYRTSTPLRAEGQFRDSIAKELAAQIRSIRSSPDGSKVEVETAAPLDFSVKGENPNARYPRKAEKIDLAEGESFSFPGLHGYTMVTVKRILRDKVEFEYRLEHVYEGRKARDTGTVELAFGKKQGAQARPITP